MKKPKFHVPDGDAGDPREGEYPMNTRPPPLPGPEIPGGLEPMTGIGYDRGMPT
jgi:hypothetical protein